MKKKIMPQKKPFVVAGPFIAKALFLVVALLCLTQVISPPLALLSGIGLAQFPGNPFTLYTKKATALLLQCSVVGLGFGMDAVAALKAGREGFLLAIGSIAITLLAGFLAGKMLKIERKTAFLISAGTAICGGSAIAALSPVIRADERQVPVALGTVFVLNALALFLFPFIGHELRLSQEQFGLWCAIAIHDTSAVVGAAGKYGAEALQIATTVKLARALWIIPLAAGASLRFRQDKARIRMPYFIGFFVLAMLAHTYLPFVQQISGTIVPIAHAGLTLTLFLIGSSLSGATLRHVGFRPMVQGLLLWILISVLALWVIVHL